MWIVMLNGGLGNQMFQYIFALYLVQNGARVMIDDAAFFGAHVEHNAFEVPKFFPHGILPRLSEYFSPDVWAEMVARKDAGTPILEQLHEEGLSLRYIQERHSVGPSHVGHSTIVAQNETTEILALPREQTTYFWGYWLSSTYFIGIQENFLSQFRFPPFPSAAQEQLAHEIKASGTTAAIHVRRGDMAKFGWSYPPEYFRQAIHEFEQQIPIDRFFLFSDDLDYCMEHAEELGLYGIRSRLTIVDGNRGADAYVDMQLMSLCRFRIADRSSFSHLAGILCRVPGNFTSFWQDPFVKGFTVPV